jgi:hypothetical protein
MAAMRVQLRLKQKTPLESGVFIKWVHLAILTPGLPGTTFADGELNCRVRDGIGCFLTSIDTPKAYLRVKV